MSELGQKDYLLLELVTKNNALQTKYKRSRAAEKEIWGVAAARLIALGKEMLDYANYLTEDELRDFIRLYNTSDYVTNRRKASVEDRTKASEQFMSLVIGAEDLLHRIIIPSLPSTAVIQYQNSIKLAVESITFSLDFLEVTALFSDKNIDNILSFYNFTSEEKRQETRTKLEVEFERLKRLTAFVKEYFEGVQKIIAEKVNETSTKKDLLEVVQKLKEVEQMIAKIYAAYNAKSFTAIQSNTNSLEEMVSTGPKM